MYYFLYFAAQAIQSDKDSLSSARNLKYKEFEDGKTMVDKRLEEKLAKSSLKKVGYATKEVSNAVQATQEALAASKLPWIKTPPCEKLHETFNDIAKLFE